MATKVIDSNHARLRRQLTSEEMFAVTQTIGETVGSVYSQLPPELITLIMACISVFILIKDQPAAAVIVAALACLVIFLSTFIEGSERKQALVQKIRQQSTQTFNSWSELLPRRIVAGIESQNSKQAEVDEIWSFYRLMFVESGLLLFPFVLESLGKIPPTVIPLIIIIITNFGMYRTMTDAKTQRGTAVGISLLKDLTTALSHSVHEEGTSTINARSAQLTLQVSSPQGFSFPHTHYSLANGQQVKSFALSDICLDKGLHVIKGAPGQGKTIVTELWNGGRVINSETGESPVWQPTMHIDAGSDVTKVVHWGDAIHYVRTSSPEKTRPFELIINSATIPVPKKRKVLEREYKLLLQLLLNSPTAETERVVNRQENDSVGYYACQWRDVCLQFKKEMTSYSGLFQPSDIDAILQATALFRLSTKHIILLQLMLMVWKAKNEGSQYSQMYILDEAIFQRFKSQEKRLFVNFIQKLTQEYNLVVVVSSNSKMLSQAANSTMHFRKMRTKDPNTSVTKVTQHRRSSMSVNQD